MPRLSWKSYFVDGRTPANTFQLSACVIPESVELRMIWESMLLNFSQMEARKKNPKEAKKSYQQSCDKFSRANTITPDQPNTLNDWGAALMVLTNLSAERDKQSLLDEALGKFVAADAIEKGIASYNLACHYSLRGNIEECRKQLNIAQENWKLPALGYLENDSDFKNVRKLAWFKELIAKERTANAVTTK